MEFTEKALILKTGRFREADLWLKLYTPSRGLITAFAFGGSRSRKRFMGCLDPLNLVLFGFRNSRTGSYLSLTEGSLLAGRPGLRKDPARLGQAVNCVKFFESVHDGSEGSRDAFELLSDILDELEGHATIPNLFPVLFRARVAFSQGYSPNLRTCSRCGKDLRNSVAPSLMVEQGRVSCGACGPAPGGSLRVDTQVLALLEQVRTAPPRQWVQADLTGQSRQLCYNVVERFVGYHLGLTWEDGRFRKT